MQAGGRSGWMARVFRRIEQTVPAFFVLALGLIISFAAWRFTEKRVSGEAETKFQHEVAQAVGALDRRFQDNVNLLVGLHRTAQSSGLANKVSLRIEDVNFEPALLLRIGGRLESVFVFSIDGDAISAIRVVRNPDKLAHIDRRLTTLH